MKRRHAIDHNKTKFYCLYRNLEGRAECPYDVSIANVKSSVNVTLCDGQTHEIVTGVHVSSHFSLPHNHPPGIDLIHGAPQLKYSETDEDVFGDDTLHLYEAGINQEGQCGLH
jgi:hypothetical protein